MLTEVVERLQKALADGLVSVVLYGSGAVPEGKDKYSDYNVLCVLKRITPAELGASEPVFRWWREMGNPAPLLLSEDEVRTSTDCFPIEFHDIRERHQILFGADVVAGLQIDYKYYRAHVEHELRSKTLRLRQKAGGILSQPDVLMRLMADSISTFCVLFRHAMMLAGEEPKFGKREIIEAAAEKFEIEPESFLSLLDFREEKTRVKDLQPEKLFGMYLQQVQKVVDAVDRLQQ